MDLKSLIAKMDQIESKRFLTESEKKETSWTDMKGKKHTATQVKGKSYGNQPEPKEVDNEGKAKKKVKESLGIADSLLESFGLSEQTTVSTPAGAPTWADDVAIDGNTGPRRGQLTLNQVFAAEKAAAEQAAAKKQGGWKGFTTWDPKSAGDIAVAKLAQQHNLPGLYNSKGEFVVAYGSDSWSSKEGDRPRITPPNEFDAKTLGNAGLIPDNAQGHAGLTNFLSSPGQSMKQALAAPDEKINPTKAQASFAAHQARSKEVATQQAAQSAQPEPDGEQQVIKDKPLPTAPQEIMKSANSIAQANNIADVNKITVGQKLQMPNGSTYTVAPGDTLYNIARGQYKGDAPVKPVGGGRGNVNPPTVGQTQPAKVAGQSDAETARLQRQGQAAPAQPAAKAAPAAQSEQPARPQTSKFPGLNLGDPGMQFFNPELAKMMKNAGVK